MDVSSFTLGDVCPCFWKRANAGHGEGKCTFVETLLTTKALLKTWQNHFFERAVDWFIIKHTLLTLVNIFLKHRTSLLNMIFLAVNSQTKLTYSYMQQYETSLNPVRVLVWLVWCITKWELVSQRIRCHYPYVSCAAVIRGHLAGTALQLNLGDGYTVTF